MSWEVDIVSFDGVRIRAFRTPPVPGREQVALVLPLATRPTFVERALQRLAQHFNVITWEARLLLEPEQGWSGDSALSLDAHARDALAVLDHFQVPRASLVGYCSGAALALRMAEAHAARFHKLVLVNGAYFLAPEVCDVTQYERDVLALAPLIAMNRDTAAAVFKAALASGSFHQPDHEFARDICLPYASVETFHRYGVGLAQCIQADACQSAEAITLPTLVMSGGKDDRTHPASSALIASRIARSQHSVDSEADHYSLCRAREATLERMRQFLSAEV
ncbi:alpha/beta hydrolase [Myxococcus stipitatus]|uniref:alpha/beta fold hydrolase n=1 Tax=Myxococcus stipitatus TaxID=83455 RepID=UPI0030CB57DC